MPGPQLFFVFPLGTLRERVVSPPENVLSLYRLNICPPKLPNIGPQTSAS